MKVIKFSCWSIRKQMKKQFTQEMVCSTFVGKVEFDSNITSLFSSFKVAQGAKIDVYSRVAE